MKKRCIGAFLCFLFICTLLIGADVAKQNIPETETKEIESEENVTEEIGTEEIGTEETGTEEIGTEESGTEDTSQHDSALICEAIKKIDFSSKEYPINWDIYTPQMEQEYKEAFYMTITNQIPLAYEEGQTFYFRDYLRGVWELDDIEFIEQCVKNTEYRFIDCDGDGLPELVMDIGINGFCILKYLPEEQKVESYTWLGEDELPLGSDQIGYCNPIGGDITHYEYEIRNVSGEEELKICFTVYYGKDGNEYEVSIFGSEDMSADLNQEQWDEVTERFFAALDSPITMVSFEEAFGGNFTGKEAETGNPDEAVNVYEEFLAGERTVENPNFGTIADLDDGSMRYMIYDVNGDHVPELHIQTAGDYYILAYRNKVLFILFHEQMEEGLEYYYICKNGEMVYKHTTEDKESYCLFKFEFSGKNHMTAGFYWNDSNGNGVYDEDDKYKYRYRYENNEDICTLEEWIGRTEGCLSIDKNGDAQILNLMEWKDYNYEKK